MYETEYLLHSRLPVVFALWADEDGRLYTWHSYVVLPVPADYVGIISEACWKEAIAYGMSDANN